MRKTDADYIGFEEKRERRRRQVAAAALRYYHRKVSTPEGRAAEQARIKEWRATHPLNVLLADTRRNAKRRST